MRDHPEYSGQFLYPASTISVKPADGPPSEPAAAFSSPPACPCARAYERQSWHHKTDDRRTRRVQATHRGPIDPRLRLTHPQQSASHRKPNGPT